MITATSMRKVYEAEEPVPVRNGILCDLELIELHIIGRLLSSGRSGFSTIAMYLQAARKYQKLLSRYAEFGSTGQLDPRYKSWPEVNRARK